MRDVDEHYVEWQDNVYAGTATFSPQNIDAKLRYICSTVSTQGMWAYQPFQTITEENNELRLENRTLALIVSDLAHRIETLEKKQEEDVIVLREITRDEAKGEIKYLFSEGHTLYYSDVATKLRLDLELVVEICNELINEGEIGIADSP